LFQSIGRYERMITFNSRTCLLKITLFLQKLLVALAVSMGIISAIYVSITLVTGSGAEKNPLYEAIQKVIAEANEQLSTTEKDEDNRGRE